MQRRLEGKVAIVTGGARGLGRAIAERLAQEGAAVAVVSAHEETAADAAAAIERTGGRALAIAADVSREEDARRYVAETVDGLGRLDVLVNNAGTILINPLVETDAASWDRLFEVNVRGVFLGCRQAARQMIEQGEGGRIVNGSSGAGRRGAALISAYAASKFAVIGLTQSLAVELAPHRITVNAYCPGHVTTTPMWDRIAAELGPLTGAAPEAAKEAVLRDVPLARSGTPEEIAAAVAFLASEDASFVTGESLLVDGGLVRF